MIARESESCFAPGPGPRPGSSPPTPRCPLRERGSPDSGARRRERPSPRHPEPRLRPSRRSPDHRRPGYIVAAPPGSLPRIHRRPKYTVSASLAAASCGREAHDTGGVCASHSRTQASTSQSKKWETLHANCLRWCEIKFTHHGRQRKFKHEKFLCPLPASLLAVHLICIYASAKPPPSAQTPPGIQHSCLKDKVTS